MQVERIRVPAGGEAALQPGGYHLMLMSPRHAIQVGDTVTLVLHFSDDRELTVPAIVQPTSHHE